MVTYTLPSWVVIIKGDLFLAHCCSRYFSMYFLARKFSSVTVATSLVADFRQVLREQLMRHLSFTCCLEHWLSFVFVNVFKIVIVAVFFVCECFTCTRIRRCPHVYLGYICTKIIFEDVVSPSWICQGWCLVFKVWFNQFIYGVLVENNLMLSACTPYYNKRTHNYNPSVHLLQAIHMYTSTRDSLLHIWHKQKHIYINSFSDCVDSHSQPWFWDFLYLHSPTQMQHILQQQRRTVIRLHT